MQKHMWHLSERVPFQTAKIEVFLFKGRTRPEALPY